MIENSVQKRVVNNYTVGLISFLLTFFQAIILVPILLKYWGNELYGIWLSLFAAFTLLQTLDLGHQAYIGNQLNVEYHKDKQKFSQDLGSSIIIALFLGLVELLITIIIILSGYLNEFLGISNEVINYLTLSYSIISLVLMWIFAGSIGGILVKMLIPAGFMFQSLIWGIVFKAAQFLSLVLVALSGGKILLASIVYAIVQIILSFFVFRYIKDKMPEFYPWLKDFNFKIGFNNLKKSSILTLNNLLQQLSTNGLVLFITNVFSSSIVPAFTTVRTLTNTASVFTNLFITSIQPDLIKYHAKKEIDKLCSTINANWFFSGLIVNLGLIMILPIAERIFNIWTRGVINFDFDLFITLAASVSVINFGAGFYNYLYGINNLSAVTVITITRLIILFLFSYYLSGFIGLSGIGFSVLISEIFASMILPHFFVQKILKSFNGELELKASIIAAASPVIITLLALFQLIGIEFNYYIWGISLFLIILSYLFNWSILDKEVKERTMLLIRNLF